MAEAFKVGDVVQWTSLGGNGRKLSMRRRDGKIVEINTTDQTAVVQPRRAKRVTVHLTKLRRQDEKPVISEFMEIMRESIGKKPA